MPSESETAAPVLTCTNLVKSFPHTAGRIIRALDDVAVTVAAGGVTGLLGPDGAGKTTLMRLAAGLLRPDSGSIHVLGFDLATDPQSVQSRVGYMPQKFGLYEDLTVQQNLDLYADLHGLPPKDRPARYTELVKMTGLGPFTARPAGRLSGGMKQKLGLACTLLSTPQLLMLDEPTVGVDPVSRRELWEILDRLVAQRHITVLVSTAYLDEADRCRDLIIMNGGKVLGAGLPSRFTDLARDRVYLIAPPPGSKPRQLQATLLRAPGVVDATLQAQRVRVVLRDPDAAQTVLADQTAEPAPPRCEDGFMLLLNPTERPHPPPIQTPTLPAATDQAIVQVRDLVKDFARFRAVDHVSFEVHRGEIFGLLGPNGAGKSTTFRMLCGILPSTAGELRVAGVDLRRARAAARQRIGYVAQKFSLYGNLTVLENLRFFAGAYGLSRPDRARRVDWALDQFELRPVADQTSGELPDGFKKRLAMACAIMHEPEILFLDEPTSGIDPLARREFWQRISHLADAGVTIIITTHFMEEAEYCDRMVIMTTGRVIAHGTPDQIRALARVPAGTEPTVEDAFVTIVQDDQAKSATEAA
jgi:ABC-2 type transport system ATP-binding protein